MGLETLKSRRDRAKLKWWYKVCRLPDNRYPKQLLSQEWEIKPRKGRQRKTWSRTIDDIFHSLSIDKGEILDDLHASICMAIVMRELDSCLSLDQEHMV